MAKRNYSSFFEGLGQLVAIAVVLALIVGALVTVILVWVDDSQVDRLRSKVWHLDTVTERHTDRIDLLCSRVSELEKAWDAEHPDKRLKPQPLFFPSAKCPSP